MDPNVLKAIAHPLRYRILVRLSEGTASPSGVARELGVPVGRVSHHVRTLVRLGAIRLVATRQRRGATEHFYEAAMSTVLGPDDWEALPLAARTALTHDGLARVVEDATRAAAASGFDAPWTELSYILCSVDDEARDAIVGVLDDARSRIVAIRDAAAATPGPKRWSTEVALLHFERVPEDPSA